MYFNYKIVLIVSWFGNIKPRLPEGVIVPVGAIFKPGDEEAKTAFRYAQSEYNQISTNPFSIVPLIEDIDVSDSFTIASRIFSSPEQYAQVCDRMAAGVFMFFGVKSMKSLDIVQSFTRRFRMPYLSPSTASWVEAPHPSYEIHLKPDYVFAIIEMILHFHWSKVHYVYDSDEGLNHIQQVLSTLRDLQDQAHQTNIDVVARRIYNTEHAHDELRHLDRMETDPTMLKVIIFDLSSEQAYKNILRQIPEVGMNKEGYHYLVATLDFANLDMGRYIHGGVNITGFQLLDLESDPVKFFMNNWRKLDKHTYPNHDPNKLSVKYESALAADAVKVITLALESMVSSNPRVFQSTFRRGEVFNYNKTKGIPCNTNPPVPWMHGDAIMKHIKMVDFEGLTGRIRFDEGGYRTDFKLDVYTVGLDTKSHKIGSYYSSDGFLSDFVDKRVDFIDDGEVKPKIVTSIESQPFLMEKSELDKNGNPRIGNDRYEGYIPDLAQQISEKLHIDYVFQLVSDGKYGAYVKANDSWDGMVGTLMREEAHFSMSPLTITYDREKVVDFTKPFMNFGISIMIKKPEIMKPGVFSFMEPLEMKIWICIVMAYIFVSGFLFIVSRFSPYEWQSSSDAELENKFDVLNSFWFSMGALMLQGSDACPRSFSGRVIGTVWWFFVLITISSYTANLAAFLTIERMYTPIDGPDDLAAQSEIKYGILESGSTKQFFQSSKVPTYSKMWNFMSSNPSVFAKNVEEGIDRVKNSKGKYAFLLESPTNEYINNKDPCDTIKVGQNLNSKGFGIATPKYSPLRNRLNLAVLMLMEDGTLLKLKTKWWKDKGVCINAETLNFIKEHGISLSKVSDSSGKRKLSLSNVAGIFYILVGGLAVAVIWASVEFLCTKSKFLEKTTYLTATETVTTLLSTPTADKENGGLASEHTNNTHHEKEESTYNYNAAPACIGFEQYYT